MLRRFQLAQGRLAESTDENCPVLVYINPDDTERRFLINTFRLDEHTLSVVFMPLNIIAGIGGMSEFSMMTNGVDWRLAYILFTLGLVGVGYLTYYILRSFGLEKAPKG